MSIALTCSNLNKKYGRTYALRNLDLQLEENVIYGLLGQNGAGKTTLLNTIAGGITPNGGTIEVRGKKARQRRAAEGFLLRTREKQILRRSACSRDFAVCCKFSSQLGLDVCP